MTPRTKLAVLDHITSKTALILPVAEMIKECRAHGISVLVDGAHAPGPIALDIPSLQADWYVGNLHKWHLVPRGCGFLWVAPQHQRNLFPNVLSWEIDQPFPARFEWTGTRDASIFLSIPAAVDFMDRFGAGKIRAHNHALINEAADFLAREWKTPWPAPSSMTGNMTLIPMPQSVPFEAGNAGCKRFQEHLWQKFQIVAPAPMAHDGHIFLRLSAQIYNASDYQRLAEAVAQL